MRTATSTNGKDFRRVARRRTSEFTPVWLLVTLLGGFLVYMQNVSTIVGYGAGVLGLIGVCLSGRWASGRVARIVRFCMLAFLFSTTVSVVRVVYLPDLSATAAENLQHICYPITASVALLFFGNCVRESRKVLFWFAAIAGVTHGAVAFFNSLCGPFNIPLLGTLEHGRYIFFTQLSSSAGFFDSVNYFATSQLMLFWLAMGMRKFSGISNSRASVLCWLILASTVVGSSRGALLAATASCCLYWIVARPFGSSRLIFIMLVCTASTLAVLYLDVESESVSHGLRMHRGLNSRDLIWDAATEVIKEHPLFGIGGGFGDELQLRGCTIKAAQNVTIASLLRGGIFGTIPWLVAAITCFSYAVRRREMAWAAAAIAVWAVDGMVRTYSLGGLGLIPLIASLAMGWVVSVQRSAQPRSRAIRRQMPIST